MHNFLLPTSSDWVVVRDVSKIDSRWLISHADACVTLATGLQFQCLMLDCPLITLGNDFLMGRNIAFETHMEAELAPNLKRALARDGWQDRLQHGRALIASMFEHELFGIDDQTPTKLKLGDMALLFSRYANYQPPDVMSVQDRLTVFELLRSEASDRVERNRLQIQLNAILSSRSWKLTAPLRKSAEQVRKILGIFT